MTEIFIKISEWFAEKFDLVFKFFRANRNSAFLWIGLFLIGVLITKFTYDVLNRGKEQ